MRESSNSPADTAELQALRRAVGRDPLTGLANRIELDVRLTRELATFQQGGPAFALVFLDVDFFKRINDRYGHSAGDRVLVGLAGLLVRESDDRDLIARYGGDEFLVLRPETDLPAARQHAERLRAAIERIPIGEPSPLPVTISGGVTVSEAGDSLDTLLHRADRALYRAKQSGRNRMCVLTTTDLRDQPDPPDFDIRFDEPCLCHARLAAPPSFERLLAALGRLLSDGHAVLTAIDGDRATLRFGGGPFGRQGVRNERRPVEATLEFGDLTGRYDGELGILLVAIRPLGRTRDTEAFQTQARQVVELVKTSMTSPSV